MVPYRECGFSAMTGSAVVGWSDCISGELSKAHFHRVAVHPDDGRKSLSRLAVACG